METGEKIPNTHVHHKDVRYQESCSRFATLDIAQVTITWNNRQGCVQAGLFFFQTLRYFCYLTGIAGVYRLFYLFFDFGITVDVGTITMGDGKGPGSN